MYILIFIFRLPLVTTASEIFFAIFKLTALRPAAKLFYVCYVQTFNMSFPSLVENQDNRKKDITHVSYSRGIKTSDYCYHINRRIRLTLPPNSNDDSFAGSFFIPSCNKLRVTNCTIIIFKMSQQML